MSRALLLLPLLASGCFYTDIDALRTAFGDTGIGTVDTGEADTDSDTDTDTGYPPGEIHEDITSDTTWSSHTDYSLHDVIYVRSGATLTIEEGTRIESQGKAALVVSTDGRIDARGTAELPIVFTSSAGTRHAGDWGGLVLLGEAPINEPAGTAIFDQFEGAFAGYGGSDATHDCGTLSYVRLEFTGYELFGLGKSLNGLSLAGCGSDTEVDHVQVHEGADDAVELIGGTVDVSHLLLTHYGDDGLDWDQGWTGRGQFIIVQQGTERGEHGIEADNDKDDPYATPRSAPEIYNLTLLGQDLGGGERGALLRRGTEITLRNFILTGFGAEAFDVRDLETVESLTLGSSVIEHGIIDDIAGGSQYFADESADDDDGGFSELAYVQGSERSIDLGVDPRLGGASGYVPDSASAATGPGLAPPDDGFFDPDATWLGAVEPMDEAPWYEPWADFPSS